MLPGGRKYIEQGVEEYGIYDHYEQDAFSGIFPRRVGTVSSVRSEEVADDEGNKFTVYYFRDGELDLTPTSTSWRVRQNVCRSRQATWSDSGRVTTTILR